MTTAAPSIGDDARLSRRRSIRKKLDAIAEKRAEVKKLDEAKRKVESEIEAGESKLNELDEKRVSAIVAGESDTTSATAKKVKAAIEDSQRAKKVLVKQIAALKDETKDKAQLTSEYRRLADPQLLVEQWVNSNRMKWAKARSDAAQAQIERHQILKGDPNNAEGVNAAYDQRIARYEAEVRAADAELTAAHLESADIEARIMGDD